jgi:hypothetical protein
VMRAAPHWKRFLKQSRCASTSQVSASRPKLWTSAYAGNATQRGASLSHSRHDRYARSRRSALEVATPRHRRYLGGNTPVDETSVGEDSVATDGPPPP